MNTADQAAKTVKQLTQGSGIINGLHRAGVRSEYAYVAAFASIGLSWLSYAVSRGKADDSKAQADRWGIYIGNFAPTLLALGVALKLEETH